MSHINAMDTDWVRLNAGQKKIMLEYQDWNVLSENNDAIYTAS
jgi:hypothetical protein